MKVLNLFSFCLLLQDYLPYPTAKENVCEGINLTGTNKESEKIREAKKEFLLFKNNFV